MARRPGFEPNLPDSFALTKAKEAIKMLDSDARAHLLLWFVKYFNDGGSMFSPSVSTSERRRVVIDNETFWLVKVPTK
jgi:hypothetical protein